MYLRLPPMYSEREVERGGERRKEGERGGERRRQGERGGERGREEERGGERGKDGERGDNADTDKNITVLISLKKNAFWSTQSCFKGVRVSIHGGGGITSQIGLKNKIFFYQNFAYRNLKR